MLIDLQKDAETVRSELEKKIAAFAKSPATSPPLKRIDIGYDCEQSGWVCIYLDRRMDAESDGEWTNHIEPRNTVDMPHWQAAWEAMEDQPVTVRRYDGSEVTVTDSWEQEDHAALFGEMLKEVLIKAREDGLFNGLRKAAGCEVGVENFDGHYGWPAYEDREQARV